MRTIPATQSTVATPVAEASTTAVGTAAGHQGPASTRRPCPHQPPCPSAHAPDREAARIACAHPEQGWSLLCNGVILFDDTGELLPDGQAIAPHRCGMPVRAVSGPHIDGVAETGHAEVASAADQFVPGH